MFDFSFIEKFSIFAESNKSYIQKK